MTNLARRSFLQRTGVTAATLGLLPALPALAAIGHPPKAAAPRSATTGPGSMVVHVNDVATGAITLLVGEREVVLHDPRLVAYFIEAAR